jgi:hypothetical protein
MYASIKRFFARLFVVGLVAYGIAVTAVAINLESEREDCMDDYLNYRALLIRAAQALTEEERLRIADQSTVDMCGRDVKVASTRWEFVHEMVLFRNYKADQVVYRD